MKRTCPICQTEYYLDKRAESIIADFPDKKDFWVQSNCPENANHFKILRKREVAKIPLEKKQKVLDLFHNGKSIGEINKELDFDTMITCEILLQNIDNIPILRTEAR